MALGFDLGEMREGVNTWHIVEAEEEPECFFNNAAIDITFV